MCRWLRSVLIFFVLAYLLFIVGCEQAPEQNMVTEKHVEESLISSQESFTGTQYLFLPKGYNPFLPVRRPTHR